jgi:hypothetical protein
MGEPLALDDFLPCLGQSFTTAADGQALALSLAQATPLPGGATGARQGFVLVFEGPALLSQGLHALHHPAVGPLDIFLVPVGNCPLGLQYEAVFN